jgi:RES domain-containing protein
MFLYRVAVKRYAHDLSGQGAQQYGGRWNPKGMAALYTAESPAQALLEYLPHFPDTGSPPDLMLVTLWFPESLSVLELPEDKIPAEWAFRPPHPSTIHIGRTWLINQATVALRVPSVMLPYGKAWNLILNPAHPDYATGKLVEVASLPFDPRLAKKLVKT